MKNEEKELQEEFVEFFEEVFGRKKAKKYMNLRQLPLLAVIYDRLKEDVCMESKKCERLRKRQNKILDKLQKHWTERQIKLFEEYCDLDSQMDLEMERQNFMFGVLISNELDKEIKKYKDKNIN